MNKRTAVFFLAMFLSLSVAAQIPTTRRECTRRCIAMDPANPRKAASDEKLTSIREKKGRETDTGKIKDLEKQEALEMERHQDELENMCATICKNNPED